LSLLFAIAVSKPDGTVYRLGLEWSFHSLASWCAAIIRLT
jgi:hypothetical protein